MVTKIHCYERTIIATIKLSIKEKNFEQLSENWSTYSYVLIKNKTKTT